MKQPSSAPHWYAVLDLKPGSSHNEILHAYNRAKRTYTAGSLASYSILEDEISSEILKEVEEAYSVLGHPSRRREYDLHMGFATWSEEGATSDRASSDTATTLSFPRVLSKAAASEAAESTAKAEPQTPSAVKRVDPASTPNFEANPEFENKIATLEVLDGAFLKALRIYRRFTVDALAQRCKLSSAHVQALEEEDWERFPQMVYLRGHLYLVAQALEVPDPNRLAKSYIDRMAAQGRLPKRPF